MKQHSPWKQWENMVLAKQQCQNMNSISGRRFGKLLVKGEHLGKDVSYVTHKRVEIWKAVPYRDTKSLPHSAFLQQVEEKVTIHKIHGMLILEMVKGENPGTKTQHIQLLFLNKVVTYCKNSQVT